MIDTHLREEDVALFGTSRRVGGKVEPRERRRVDDDGVELVQRRHQRFVARQQAVVHGAAGRPKRCAALAKHVQLETSASVSDQDRFRGRRSVDAAAVWRRCRRRAPQAESDPQHQ